MEMKVTIWLQHQSQPHIFYGVGYVLQGPTMFQLLFEEGHFVVEHCKIESFQIERGEQS